MPLFGGHKRDKKHNTLQKDESLNSGSGAASGMTGSSMPGGVTAADSNLPPPGGRATQQQDTYNRPQGHTNQQPIANDYGNPGTMNDQSLSSGGGGMGMSNDGYKMTPGNIPPSENLNVQGGAGHSTTGKVEKAIGSMVGSNALKAKGMQKEMEANALKTQSSELAEAERLERDALLRRERAVAHGAHPDNRHLGGMPGGQNGLQ